MSIIGYSVKKKGGLGVRNRTVTNSLLGIVVLLFIAYFIARYAVLTSTKPIESELNNIINYAQEERWSDAEVSSRKLMSSWEKNKYLIALNYAEADYLLFVDNLSRMNGAIKTKDDTETVGQAMSALKLWNNFLRIVPEP
ncbi:MAG: hypothetical protein K0S51_1128 [Bacillales bacterium]|nr:hypothetical protein [Bacillales bacterium]